MGARSEEGVVKLPWKRETDHDRKKSQDVDDVTRRLALALLEMDRTLKSVKAAAQEVVNGRNGNPRQEPT